MSGPTTSVDALEAPDRSGAGSGAGSEPDALMVLVYDELRRLAAHHLRKERAGHTLQPTALVHEAYLRLAEREGVHLEHRDDLLAVAVQAMRRVLVDHARRRNCAKRSVPPDGAGESLQPSDAAPLDLVALEEHLSALESVDPRAARVIELRFFGGLTIDETARILGVTDRTVRRDWTMARAWLGRAMEEERAD